MSKAIKESLAKQDSVLMVTFESSGPSYSLDNGVAVGRKLAASLLANESRSGQCDLFMVPQDDGLFPGFTQTWKAR